MADTSEEKDQGSGSRSSVFRPVWITALFLTLSVSLTLLLFRGVKHPSLFSTNILVVTLVNLNITLAILLVLLLSRNLIKFYFERRREPNKSSLKGKLIAGLIGLSMIPSILLFVVASGLLTSSIENWFSIQVEKSLDQSLEVAQDYYQETEKGVTAVTTQIGRFLLRGNRLKWPHQRLVEAIDRKKTEYRLHHVALFTPKRQPFAETTQAAPSLAPGHPTPEALEEALKRAGGRKGSLDAPVVTILSTPQGDLVRGVLPLMKGRRLAAILVVDHLIPSLLVEKMEGIKKSVEEYKQLKAFKNPIKGSYILSFLIIVLLIIFSATWFGLYLARNITLPIQRLAEGTQAVAQGDLNFRIDVRATDELGILVDSFNKMTADLKESQRKINEATRSLVASNRELEGVLQNIAAGVISVDAKGIVTTFNPSAEKILDVRAESAIQKDYIDVFSSRGMETITRPLQ